VPNGQYKPHDDGQERYPKHVEFYNRINLKFVRLIGYEKGYFYFPDQQG
jgi:hypothetical protein